MLRPVILLTVLVAAFFSGRGTEGALRRVCYYTNWAQYRPGAGRFVPENVDPSLCTHYIYAFATLRGNNIKAFEWNDESTPWSKGMFERFQALKQKNPAMKTLLALGGWNMASSPFTQMVATQQSRAQFIQSVIPFLRKNGFDGLDVDWEYPANRGSPAGDRDRFTALIRELRASFDQESATAGKPRLLLTSAVAAGKSNIDTAYDIPELNKYLDFFNLMTYDLHGSWEPYTGHHTALFPRAAETGDDRDLNVDFVAKYWVQKGASKDKLVIGVSSYGRSFTLTSPSQNGVGAPAGRAGAAGTYTRENGFLAFYEVCQMIKNGGQVHEDSEQHVRYVTHGNQWVGYEDEKSVTEKVCYIKQQGYGGVMMWALDEDDFSGQMCGRGPYPLLHAINNEVNNPNFNNCPNPAGRPQVTVQPPLTTQRTAYINTTPPPAQGPASLATYPRPAATNQPFPGVLGVQTPAPGSNTQGFSCMNLPNDFYPSPRSCNEYIICANQVIYRVHCASGLHYNPVTQHCDWPNLAHCINAHTGSQPTSVPTTPTPAVFSQPPVVTTRRPAWTFSPPAVTTQPPRPTSTQSHIGTTAPARPNQPLSPATFCASQPDGQYRDPSDCNLYVECLMHMGFSDRCPKGMVFNQAMGSCQHPYNTPECANYHDINI